jgi:O-antigen ligase
MKLNLTTPSLLIVIVGSFISILFFTEIYTEIFPILLLAFFFLSLAIIKLKRIFFSKKFLATIFIFLVLILYNLINRNNGVIYEFNYEDVSKLNFNIYHTLIIYLCTFIIGYFYSLQLEYPLKLLSKIISIQLAIFFVYVLILTYINPIDKQVNLATGRNVFIFVPFFLIAFNLQNNKLLILFYIVLISYLTFISNRGSIIAVTFFFISYAIYPFLIKKSSLFKIYFLINIFFIIFIFYFYLAQLNNDFFTNIFRELFDKRLNTRGFIWIELIEIIKEKYLFGYGSDQASNYISYDGEFNRKNLSSHNLYLEIVLTGGLLGLFLFLLLLFSLFNQFYSYRTNHWGRICSSLIIGLMYAGLTSQDFIKGNVVYICMIFFLLAIASAQVTKTNKLYNQI